MVVYSPLFMDGVDLESKLSAWLDEAGPRRKRYKHYEVRSYVHEGHNNITCDHVQYVAMG